MLCILRLDHVTDGLEILSAVQFNEILFIATKQKMKEIFR